MANHSVACIRFGPSSCRDTSAKFDLISFERFDKPRPPQNKNPHTSYPFGLHAEYSLAWGYESANGTFFLRANTCLKGLLEEEQYAPSVPSPIDVRIVFAFGDDASAPNVDCSDTQIVHPFRFCRLA
ncbi:hypothetical protein B0H14DRAFT_3452357 [Mycena olivaceomarginata]|nr:hypothetical protein B0H14DRAFT_3452357 [Mycena olivaceomarginata]